MIGRAFAHLGRALRDLLTGRDGATYAPSRVYWCLAAVQFLALSAWSVIVLKNAFDAQAFGTGAGLILTAGGVGVWITRKTEPDA